MESPSLIGLISDWLPSNNKITSVSVGIHVDLMKLWIQKTDGVVVNKFEPQLSKTHKLCAKFIQPEEESIADIISHL